MMVKQQAKNPHFWQVQDKLMEKTTDYRTFYWPDWHRFGEDGTLKLKFSEYTADIHSTGMMEIKTTEPDYPLWLWILKGKNYDDIISDEQLEKFRHEFAKESLNKE